MCSSGFLSNFKLTGLPFPQWTAALVPGRRVTGFIQIELTDGRNPGVRIFPIIQPSKTTGQLTILMMITPRLAARAQLVFLPVQPAKPATVRRSK
jgi:hypothetical protein